jgi:shikimate kinase
MTEHLDRPLVLVGMMGSGKSHIGALLAQRLDVAFCDADAQIVAQAGCDIPAIFAQSGERAFRALEAAVMAELLDRGPCVIASGGGAILSDASRNLMRNKAISVWLDTDLDVIYARIKDDTGRPLLQNDDPEATLHDLFDQRRAYYAQADIHLKISDQDPLAVCESLLKELAHY